MRTRCLIFPLLVIGCIACLPARAVAGTVYEVNTTGATKTGSKDNDVFIGQSFNSGSNTLLTAATLQINSGTFAIGNFTLNLHLTTGSPGAYFKAGSTLASLTLSNNVLSTSSGAFYTFSNLNWAMQPNTVYMLGIASDSNPTVRWTLNQSATRDSSTGFITGYSGYNAQQNTSVDDGLHGATISAVPEPPTVALAAIAGLATFVLRRRRATGRRAPSRSRLFFHASAADVCDD